MSRKAHLYLFVISYFFLFLIYSCDKDDNKSYQTPTCQISYPNDEQEIALGETINISILSSSNNAVIEEVKLYINDKEKSSLSNYPYNYLWTTDDESYGKNTIKATSTDSEGGITSDIITVYITEEGSGNPPNVNFTANVTSGTNPLTINFIDLSTNYPTSWYWDFGDGESNTQQNPDHSYNVDGYYTVKLIAVNDYGSDTLIKTNYIYVGVGGIDGEPCPGTPTVIDADSNVYNTILIGNRCWMKENLRVGLYIKGNHNMSNNGRIEKYCYNDKLQNCLTYGGLYQWNEMMHYSSEEGQQGICPDGWHLPSDDEWKQLEMHVGMTQYEADQIGFRGTNEGYKLKSEIDWSNNGNGNNTSGFSAKPGGYRYTTGSFRDNIFIGSWWSTTQYSSSRAWRRGLYYNSKMARRNHHDKTDGLSVRCIKN